MTRVQLRIAILMLRRVARAFGLDPLEIEAEAKRIAALPEAERKAAISKVLDDAKAQL